MSSSAIAKSLKKEIAWDYSFNQIQIQSNKPVGIMKKTPRAILFPSFVVFVDHLRRPNKYILDIEPPQIGIGLDKGKYHNPERQFREQALPTCKINATTPAAIDAAPYRGVKIVQNQIHTNKRYQFGGFLLCAFIIKSGGILQSNSQSDPK